MINKNDTLFKFFDNSINENFDKNFDENDYSKVPVDEVISDFRTLLKRFYNAPDNRFDIYHELRFAIEANLLHLCKYSVNEVFEIMRRLSIVDVPEDRLKQEIEYIAEHGYIYPSFEKFKQKAMNTLVFSSVEQQRKYEKMLKRIWELFTRLAQANKEVSRVYVIQKKVLDALVEDVEEKEMFRRIYLTAKDVTYFGRIYKDENGKDKVVAYTSVEDLVKAYLRRKGKEELSKEDIGDFLKFVKEEVTEVLVMHDALFAIDFDTKRETLEESRRVNLEASKELFDRIKDCGVTLISHTTGGKGVHIVGFVDVWLDEDKKVKLKELILDDIKKYVQEVALKYGADIEVLDGSKKLIALWYGRHRKTGEQKSIIGRVCGNFNRAQRYVMGKVKELVDVGDVSINMKYLTLDSALMFFEFVKNVSIADKERTILSIKNFIEDLEDEDYNIPEQTRKVLDKLYERVADYEFVKRFPIGEFEKRYGYSVPFKDIEEMEKYYSERLDNLPKAIDACVIDFETENNDVFAFVPTMATFYFNRLRRLVIWMRSDEDVVEIYRDSGYEVRVVKSMDPEIILGAVFPEWLMLGIAKKYLKRGSYLYEVDFQKFVIVEPRVDYLEEFIRNPKKIYLVAFNIGFDGPLLLELLKGLKEGSVIKVEDFEEGQDVIINLYDGFIDVKGRIRSTRSSNTVYTSFSMKIGEQYIKGLDVANLGKFWQEDTKGHTRKRTLKALSESYNKFFKKLGDFDVSVFNEFAYLMQDKEEFAKALKYNILDVLSTYELMFSLVPIDLKKELDGFGYFVEDKIVKLSEFIKIEDFIKMVSPATIPKKIYEGLIKSFGESQYLNNSFVLNSLFESFYYGGRVYVSVGRTKDVVYLDFASQYPHIMNYLFIENIIANLAKRELDDVLKVLDDVEEREHFKVKFQNAIDKFVETFLSGAPSAYKYIADFVRTFPQGVFYVSPTKPKVIDAKMRVLKDKGKFEFNGYRLDISFGSKGNGNREDVAVIGSVNIDLPTLIYWALEWRLKNPNKKWKFFWKKEIRISWNNSSVIHVVEMIKPIKEYYAYGIKSYSIPHYALSVRQKYKAMMKEARKQGDKEKEELFNKRQYAMKVLANSTYGALAEENWKYLNYMIASAITGYGRLQQRIVQLLAEREGVEFIYADTDSAFLKGVKGEDRIERIRAVFKGVDDLEYEAELDELEVLASKNYRYREKGKSDWKTKVHGKGSYNAIWDGKKVFDVEFFNRVYEYLEGQEDYKDYAEPLISNINIRSTKGGQQKVIEKLLRYSREKEKSIKEKGYYVKDKYVTSHILAKDALSYGKFFKLIVVDGRVEGNEVRYLITPLYEDEVKDYLERLGLRVSKATVYEKVKKRLERVRVKLLLSASELPLTEYKQLYRECKLVKGKVPVVNLNQKPKGIIKYHKVDIKRHSTEWMLRSEIIKPTAYFIDVRHFSKAFANLYNMDKNIVGSKWIDKSASEVIFRYKVTEDGKIVKATAEDDAHIIIRVPLKVFDVENSRTKTKDYLDKFEYKIFVSINASEPVSVKEHYKMLNNVIRKWLEDLQPYLEKYVVDFAPLSVSGDLYERILEAISTKKILDLVVEDIRKALDSKSFLLIKEHFAEDFEVSRKDARLIEFLLSEYYVCVVDKVIDYLRENGTNYSLRVYSLTKIISSKGSLHFRSKGLRISIYNHTHSKLHRLFNRFRKHKTSRSLEPVKEYIKKLSEEKYIYRVEVEVSRRLSREGINVDDEKLDIIELFESIKEFFKEIMKLKEIIKYMIFEDVFAFLDEVFSKTAERIIEFLKDVKSLGKRVISRIRRYTIVLITYFARGEGGVLKWARQLLTRFKRRMNNLVHSLDEYYDLMEIMKKERRKRARELRNEYAKGLDLDNQELDNTLTLQEQINEIGAKMSFKFNPELYFG